ncbi:hypothetical protein A2U01_0048469 [Trifolium medium]|uniref:Uncharacterized protein n=1 Tax=Trifolium medium TaxID=97028 RepID=A0A392QS99_9FABA|nr:hypothetical protein [Trifolium medium]
MPWTKVGDGIGWEVGVVVVVDGDEISVGIGLVFGLGECWLGVVVVVRSEDVGTGLRMKVRETQEMGV